MPDILTAAPTLKAVKFFEFKFKFELLNPETLVLRAQSPPNFRDKFLRESFSGIPNEISFEEFKKLSKMIAKFLSKRVLNSNIQIFSWKENSDRNEF